LREISSRNGRTSRAVAVRAAELGIDPVIQGAADKLAVQTMVARLLGLHDVPRPPDAADALALFTTGAGQALRAPTLGRLVEGGPADLIVVEPDPLRAPPDEVADARVGLTLVAGKAAWRA